MEWLRYKAPLQYILDKQSARKTGGLTRYNYPQIGGVCSAVSSYFCPVSEMTLTVRRALALRIASEDFWYSVCAVGYVVWGEE